MKKNKCAKCSDQVYSAGFCKKHYKEEFDKNMKSLPKRWDLQ